MNTAGYCHGLPSEQGDPLEASLACGMGIYASRLLPFSACSRCERATSLTAHDMPRTATSLRYLQFKLDRRGIPDIPRNLVVKTPKYALMKKGQHSLVESVTLKAPVKLLYDSSVCYIISQRCTAPRITIPSRTNTMNAAAQLPSALLKLSLHSDVHLFKHAV